MTFYLQRNLSCDGAGLGWEVGLLKLYFIHQVCCQPSALLCNSINILFDYLLSNSATSVWFNLYEALLSFLYYIYLPLHYVALLATV